MLTFFSIRARQLPMLLIGALALVASCKNPAAPREPNKFASQATFLRVLDSVSIQGQSVRLTRGKTTGGIFLKDGSGYIFIGDLQLGSANNSTLFITRTNLLGGILWTRLYDTDLTIFPKTIIQEADGFAVGGTTFNLATKADAYLLKLNNSFEKVWSRSYDIDSSFQEVNGIVKHSSTAYLLFGRVPREVVRQITPVNIVVFFIDDGYVASCDADGNLISQRRIQSLGSRLNIGGSDVIFNSGASTPFNTVLAGFYSPVGLQTFALAKDLYLLRISANGDTSQLIYDSFSVGGDVGTEPLANAKRNTADEAISSLISPTGEIYTLGQTNNTFFILKTDETLTGILSRFSIQVPSGASLTQAAFSHDGNFVFVGASTQKISQNGIRSNAPGGRDVYIAKYSPQGNLIWEITQGTNSDDVGLTIQETIDKGFIITGTSNDKPLLLKVDERGLLAE